MKIAVYSRKCDEDEILFIKSVVTTLASRGCEIVFHQICHCPQLSGKFVFFANHTDLANIKDVDFLLSFGGDGTFIDAANLVGDLNIPLVGINTGRIGFLTAINRNNYKECLTKLLSGQYVVEKRSLLHLSCLKSLDLPSDFALNDITVRTSDDNSITAIKVFVGGKPVNTYWGDGLIISTPTGSTAYSLSCGGPIIVPSTNVNVLTPIASHTLGVRPIVVSADEEIRIVVESRNNSFSLALDSNRVVVENPVELLITKEKFSIQTVLFDDTDFYRIIREKLLWGIDKRNF
ncbi:MAG: NAD(+)/NADH kinase [Bacteroidales bacterium]|nr:NAD(+)/NADH kinase [Bacteroidales bacterium]